MELGFETAVKIPVGMPISHMKARVQGQAPFPIPVSLDKQQVVGGSDT